MKIITEQECLAWLDANLGTNPMWKRPWEAFPLSVSYRLPVDTGQKTATGRFLSQAIGLERASLFWITCWGVFPSSENMTLFNGFRKSLGENRRIDEAPGHVVDSSNLEQIECLLDMALYFYWDAILFDATRVAAISTSHDEFISLHAMNQIHLSELENSIARLELKRI